MSIKANYPDIRPTLNLDFANTKRLDPRITFTRTTTGTYVGSDGLIKTAAIDEARFDHDPATGESLGLLAEEARTNLITYSEDFTNTTFWSQSNITSTANQATAPDSTTTADLLSVSSASTAYIGKTFSTNNGNLYSGSVFAKAGSTNYIQLSAGTDGFGSNVYVNFNLLDGSIEVESNVDNASIEDFGNGWYRCTISITAIADANSGPLYLMPSGASSTVRSGTSGHTAYVWGAQLEEDSFPTSYIPTSGSTVTRGKDDTKILVSDFEYVDTEYTLCVEFESLNDSGFIVGFANDADYRIFIRLIDTLGLVLDDRFNGVTQVNAGGISQAFPQNTFGKVALGYKENDLAISLNGQTPETDSSVNVGINATELRFTRGHFGSNVGNARIKCLQYYPLRLSNTVLQGLTS